MQRPDKIVMHASCGDCGRTHLFKTTITKDNFKTVSKAIKLHLNGNLCCKRCSERQLREEENKKKR